MNQHRGSVHHEREGRFHKSKKVRFSSGKAKSHEASSNGYKDLYVIINEKIAAALRYKAKKDYNKYEALTILTVSKNVNNSKSNSRVKTKRRILSENSTMGKPGKKEKVKGLGKA
eukprot:7815171-Ditylum_brightwellii.AAC.1